MTESETPSWAAPAAGEARRRPAPTEAAPVTLVLAAGLAVAVSLAEVVHVAGRTDLVPALRGFLIVVVASQIILAWRVLRRSSGAVLGLVLFEITTIVASIAGGLGEGPGRLLLALGAAAVLALLSISLRTFPAPELPPLRSGPRGSTG